MGPSDAYRDRRRAPVVSHWTFDRAIGRISACDGNGNPLMVIPAGPQFGERLAAAFSPVRTKVVVASAAVADSIDASVPTADRCATVVAA